MTITITPRAPPLHHEYKFVIAFVSCCFKVFIHQNIVLKAFLFFTFGSEGFLPPPHPTWSYFMHRSGNRVHWSTCVVFFLFLFFFVLRVFLSKTFFKHIYLIHLCNPNRFWPNRLEITPTTSSLRGKTPPTSVLDMTLNNLIVRLQ